MPTLPTLDVQISRNINGFCDWCGVAVDRRSKHCRKCHLEWLAIKRFPPEKRPYRTCRDCGGAISRRSSHYGKGRCRACYARYRREHCCNSINLEERRSVDRPNSGSCYEDEDGTRHLAYEEPLPGLSVAAAWASLRRCWKGYRIALANEDEEQEALYAGRIFFLCRLLNLEPPRFKVLEEEIDEEGICNCPDECEGEYDDAHNTHRASGLSYSS